MESLTVDLKQTLNLPHTDFSMKANLPVAEPKMLARWAEEDLYGKIREARRGKPTYILHDGPPYANGEIHLGHALNKLIKDLILKSKTMAGFDTPYVPGYDCHGLPIEFKVDQNLGSKKAKMSVAEIRAECRKYAAKWVAVQNAQFQRLGIFGTWDHPYMTMSPQYQSVIAGAFVDFLDKGYVYKGLKPVNWCIHDRTALAEAEIEYANHTSPSVWVRFALKSDPSGIDPSLAGKRVFGLIWTTTPWTLPANLAIAFNPKYVYAAAETAEGDVYIVAEDLLSATAERCGWVAPRVIATFAGAHLERAVFEHPFLDRESLGILGDHVTLEQGTGAVHTAPGHGQEDFAVSQRYGLPTYCPVDGAGKFFEPHGESGTLPPEIIGKTVWQANPIIIGILEARGALLAQQKIEHSYPHCWRCHHATIFRATEQWFIGMERNHLRERALDAIKAIKYLPEWGQERISNMIATRPDWCISRQRVWGVPIVVFYCGQCREPLTDRKFLDPVVALFAREGADVWYTKAAADLIPAGTKCERCGASEFTKETDILDVWFDSGSSHLAVLTEEYGLPWPSDLYIEGGDQYRGWFHSSLLIGVGLRNGSPYRECATIGWTLDSEGRAMSKSLGNGVDPADVIKKYGAESLRLLFASVDFVEDMRTSDTTLVRISEAYRKLRNTFKYVLGNTHDFEPTLDSVDGHDLLEFDQWILIRAEDLIARCLIWYNDFAFHKVYRAIYDFATVDLSAVYFDVLKDRLYTSAPKWKERRSAQTALYRINHALVRLLAPILAFTTEEVWGFLGEPGSVHTALFPKPDELTKGITGPQRAHAEHWNTLIEVRDTVLKELERARQEKVIGAPLEAQVTLAAGKELMPLLEEYRDELPGLFIVSQVLLEASSDTELAVRVERASGNKCERCWKYLPSYGADPRWPTVCEQCVAALEAITGQNTKQ
jgi:isoleucyl-tRNA synthetase